MSTSTVTTKPVVSRTVRNTGTVLPVNTFTQEYVHITHYLAESVTFSMQSDILSKRYKIEVGICSADQLVDVDVGGFLNKNTSTRT